MNDQPRITHRARNTAIGVAAMVAACTASGSTMNETGMDGTSITFTTWTGNSTLGSFTAAHVDITTPASNPFRQARIARYVDGNGNGVKDPGEVTYVWESIVIPGGTTHVDDTDISLQTGPGTTAVFTLEVDFVSGSWTPEKEKTLTNSSGGNAPASPLADFLGSVTDTPSNHRLSFYRTTEGKLMIDIGPRDGLLLVANGASSNPIPIIGVVISLQGQVVDSFGPPVPGQRASKVYNDTFSGVQLTDLRFDTYGDRGNGPELVMSVSGDGTCNL